MADQSYQAMTEKQAQFRTTLVREALDKLQTTASGAASMASADDRRRAAINAALILNLPLPKNTRDASDQIDALKSGILNYARTHQQWADRILHRLAARFGLEFETIPLPEAIEVPTGAQLAADGFTPSNAGIWMTERRKLAGQQWLALLRAATADQ